MSKLTLTIVTPKGTRGPVSCDSIHLKICDDMNGKGGGSYGIKAGHTKSLLSLEKGVIEAFLMGEKILTGECDVGFATVNQNVVTVVVEGFFEK